MDNITFRTISEAPAPPVNLSAEEWEPNNVGPATDIMPEPVESDRMPQTVLDVLGIEEDLVDLPEDVASNARDIASYLEDELKSQGKIPNVLTIGKQLDQIKEDLEMDEQTEMSVVLDRLGGVVKAWKNLGFMNDAASKRSIFMKLARCPDSKSMHKLLFMEMERAKVWR